MSDFKVSSEMPKKTKSTNTRGRPKKQKIVKKNEKHVSLLLPRSMFDTDKAQLIVSLLMLLILIIQVYLFINVYRLLGQMATLQLS